MNISPVVNTDHAPAPHFSIRSWIPRVKWLDHAWSLCIKSIDYLANRISQISRRSFFKAAPSGSHNPTPVKQSVPAIPVQPSPKVPPIILPQQFFSPQPVPREEPQQEDQALDKSEQNKELDNPIPNKSPLNHSGKPASDPSEDKKSQIDQSKDINLEPDLASSEHNPSVMKKKTPPSIQQEEGKTEHSPSKSLLQATDQSSPQAKSPQSKAKENNPSKPNPSPPKEILPVNSIPLPAEDTSLPANPQPNDEKKSTFATRFRRYHRDQKPSQINTIPIPNAPAPKNSTLAASVPLTTPLPLQPIIKPTAKPVAKPEKSCPYILIEAGGGGDCQLLSFLKALEMQYPQLLMYKEDDKDVKLTMEKLRTMGVEFAKKEILSFLKALEKQYSHLLNSKDPKDVRLIMDKLRGMGVDFSKKDCVTIKPSEAGYYALEVLGYLDADCKEYNDIYLPEINKTEENYKKELKTLNERFQAKRITPTAYNSQLNVIKAKYTKIVTALEKRDDAHRIRSDEEFLNRLARKGFSCSSLHLFTLSILFKLPIHVHDQYGSKDHNIQVFNATNSQLEPVHLYRVKRGHYQYMLFTKTGT